MIRSEACWSPWKLCVHWMGHRRTPANTQCFQLALGSAWHPCDQSDESLFLRTIVLKTLNHQSNKTEVWASRGRRRIHLQWPAVQRLVKNTGDKDGLKTRHTQSSQRKNTPSCRIPNNIAIVDEGVKKRVWSHHRWCSVRVVEMRVCGYDLPLWLYANLRMPPDVLDELVRYLGQVLGPVPIHHKSFVKVISSPEFAVVLVR